MDFSFTSDQQDLRELAAKILSDATTLERTKQVVAESDGFDRDLWSALADAGIVGISLPESVGGGGLGVLDIGHCSALKVYGSQLNMEGYQLLMEILGPVSYLEPDAPGAVLKSRIQQGTRGAIILTFGGGVNEMQRDLISQFTLGFPRADR